MENALLPRDGPLLPRSKMEVVQAYLSGVPLLAVVGDIDHETSAAFDDAVKGSRALDHGRLLLDLSECPYIDSGGLSVLLSAARQLPSDGWLGIVTNNKNILRLLEIVGLGLYPGIKVFDDLDRVKEYLDEEPG
jgi:anti-anti-sigma factor